MDKLALSGRNASSREVSQDRVGRGAEGPTGRVLHLHLPFVTDLKLHAEYVDPHGVPEVVLCVWVGSHESLEGVLVGSGLSSYITGIFLFVTEKTASKFLSVSFDPLVVGLFFFLSFEQLL